MLSLPLYALLAVLLCCCQLVVAPHQGCETCRHRLSPSDESSLRVERTKPRKRLSTLRVEALATAQVAAPKKRKPDVEAQKRLGIIPQSPASESVSASSGTAASHRRLTLEKPARERKFTGKPISPRQTSPRESTASALNSVKPRTEIEKRKRVLPKSTAPPTGCVAEILAIPTGEPKIENEAAIKGSVNEHLRDEETAFVSSSHMGIKDIWETFFCENENGERTCLEMPSLVKVASIEGEEEQKEQLKTKEEEKEEEKGEEKGEEKKEEEEEEEEEDKGRNILVTRTADETAKIRLAVNEDPTLDRFVRRISGSKIDRR